MDKAEGIYSDALYMVGQGVLILDENLTILLWNNHMERITGIRQSRAVTRNIFDVLPRMDKSYLRDSIAGVLSSGSKFFFSAAVHGNVLSTKEKLNLRVSLLRKEESKFLLLEFIDVTGEFARLKQRKNDLHELHHLNLKLKEKERIIKDRTYYDELTGVANRILFYKLADKFLKTAERERGLLALMFIDVDHFKCINDAYGHLAGDKLLAKAAGILSEAAGKDGVVSRYGGDEFIILFPQIERPDEIRAIATTIQRHGDSSLLVEEAQVGISFHIGVSLYPDDGETIDQLIAKADSAACLEKRKAANRNLTMSS